MVDPLRTAFVVAMVTSVALAGTAVATDAGTDSTAENLDAGTVSPSTVNESTTVDHTASFNVDSVSKDGGTDTFYVEFPNAANVSVNSATVTNRSDGSSVSISSSAELVDGPDEDAVKDTVAFAVSPSGSAESVDVNVTVSATVEWPAVDADDEYALAASVEDSSLANVGPTEFATVTVEDVEGGTDTTTTQTTAEPTTQTTEFTTDGTMTTSANGGETMTTSANGGDDTTAAGSGGSPGFGLVVAAIALAAAAGIARRRT